MTVSPVASVEIVRAEGPIHLCGRSATFPTFAHASEHLRKSVLPGQMCKHDFAVRWANGDEYRGTFVVTATSVFDLAAKVRGTLRWIAENGESLRIPADRIANARRMLETCEIG